MKPIKFLITIMAIIMTLSTCSENDPSKPQPPEESKPEPTAFGYPNGVPTIATVGSNGGVINSVDGEMSLDIPAGALSADTPIIIQPVTNNALNGNGSAYLLAPEGIQFAKPVKVTFRNKQKISDEMPAITGITFHDKDGLWYTAGKLNWDSTTKTVSVETTHFSEWATFDVMCIGCSEQKLAVGRQMECKIYAVDNDLGSDDIVPLRKPSGKNDFSAILKEWRLNGGLAAQMGKYGQVTPFKRDVEAVCTYNAPPEVPKSRNPVDISATMKDLAYKDPITKKLFNNLQLVSQIEIIGERKYHMQISYNVTNTLSDVLRDSCSADVLVKDDNVTFSNFQNFPGDIIPPSKTFGTGCTTTWTVAGYQGPIHFTEASATLDASRKMSVIIKGFTFTPASTTTCPGGNPPLQVQASSYDITWPIPFTFNMNDSIPTFKDQVGLIAKLKEY